MSVLIDTSAFIVLGDKTASNNQKAMRAWRLLVDSREKLIVASYTIVETVALLQRRAGQRGVQLFVEGVLPLLSVVYISQVTHESAMNAFLAAGAGRHAPSLVDCVSFEIIRQRGIQRVFAYDEHFSQLGCEMVGSE